MFPGLEAFIVQVVQPLDQVAQDGVVEGIFIVALLLHPELILFNHAFQDDGPQVHAVFPGNLDLDVRHLLRQCFHPVEELVPGVGKLLFLHSHHLHGIGVHAEDAAICVNRNREDFAVLLHRVLDIGLHPGYACGNLFIGAQVNQVFVVVNRAELIALVGQHVDVRMRVAVHHGLHDVLLECPVRFRNHGDIAPCIVHVINGVCNGIISAALHPQLDAAALCGIGVFNQQVAEELYQHKAVLQHHHAVAVVRAVIDGLSLFNVKLRHCPQFSVGKVVQSIRLRVIAGIDPAGTLD